MDEKRVLAEEWTLLDISGWSMQQILTCTDPRLKNLAERVARQILDTDDDCAC